MILTAAQRATVEWSDAVAGIMGWPGAPPQQAVANLVAAGDALRALLAATEPPPTPTVESDCVICEQQMSPGYACWAWHKLCRAELNPVALVQWLRNAPQTDEIQRVIRYVEAVTGMAVAAHCALPAPPEKGK